jgi:putative heme transporter
MRLPHEDGRETRAADGLVGPRLPDWLRTSGRDAWLLVGVALLGAIVFLLLGLISDLVIPLIFASILAAIFVPLVDRLERWRVRRWLGAPLVVLLVIGVVLAVVWMVVAGILDQGGEIIARVTAGFDRAGTPVQPSEQDVQEAVKIAGELVATLVNGVLRGLGSVTVLIVGVVTGLFILLFLLKDWPMVYEGASKRIAALLGMPGGVGRRILSETVHAFRGYAWGMTIVGTMNAVVMGLGAWLLGVPLPVPIAVVTFVTSYIPFFGAFFAGAFAVLIALGANGLGTALAILAIALLSNNTLQNLLEPLAFGRALRLHPLVVLLVTTAGTLLFGILGATLAAPVTAAAQNTVKLLRDEGLLAGDPPGG